MTYRLSDLLDISHIEQLINNFSTIAGLGVAIIDIDGTILMKGGWKRICTNFHRNCAETSLRCKESDRYINDHLNEGPYVSYKCLNGLMDCAAPIIVNNQHLGSVFTGQFLTEPPDEDFFRDQARRFGYDETAYLQALQQIPVIPARQVEFIMSFYSQLAQLLASMGLDKIQLLEAWKNIKESEEKLTIILEESHDGFWDWDMETGKAYFSPRWTEILGYTQDEIEPYIKSWENLIHPEDKPRVIKTLYSHLHNSTERYQTEYRMLTKSGEWKWIHGRGKALACNEKGQVTRFAGTHIDVTDIKLANEKVRHLRSHNFLTGLYNRAYFEREMHRIESDEISPVGMLICDVDGLKLINDSVGHMVGDNLLRRVAKILKRCFTDEVVIARIGGDEFAVLLPHCERDYLENSYNRIKHYVTWENLKSQGTSLSLSIGFAYCDKLPINMHKLYAEADNNMHREKLHCQQSAHGTMVNTLMKALEERDFVTGGHVNRLQDLVASLASILKLPASTINDLRLLAQFHDIGKVGISDRILFKNGPLNEEEYSEMKKHSEIGHRIAQTSPELMPIADWILKHHEWWNGQGYPLGLEGKKIPLECRILAIADAFDAMTSDRPYRKALTCHEAVEELNRCSGTQFDPDLVDKFSEVLASMTRLKQHSKMSAGS